MTTRISTVNVLAAAMVLVLLASCKASGNRKAPVEERDGSVRKPQATGKKQSLRDTDTRSPFYVVQKGDTLYSISFEYGLDYRDVAVQNNIENPSAIQIGQQIKLLPSAEDLGERPRSDSKPVTSALPILIPKKDQPKVVKLLYSDQAAAQIEKMQYEATRPSVAPVVSVPAVKPTQDDNAVSDDGMEWIIPTKGKIIGEYSESANRKGVDIAGNKGQPVNASASGKVVYSGSGLRGYGKLVIIKHNKTFLSAYAHNEQILVKEGENVSKGQKIAEMGSTDSDQVKLHFEIRKFGKPVDPAKFLNFSKF